MKQIFAAFTLALLLALIFSPSAQGAVVPERILFEASRIDDTRSGVASSGEGTVVLNVQSPPLPYLVAKTRKSNGKIGELIDLTNTSNAETPKEVLYNSRGGLFLTWGIATNGSNGQFTSRPAGGTFRATSNYTTPACGRFQSVSAKPDGGLLLACSATQGIAPADDVILVSSLPFFTSTSFSGAALAQFATEDNFMQPLTDVAPDGSMAVSWGTMRESAGVYASRIRAFVSGDGDWTGSTSTNLAFVNSATGYVSGPRLAALPGGKAAILWFEGDYSDPSYGRLHLGISNADGVIEADEIIATKPMYSYSLVREGDGLRLAWSETDGGLGDPATTKTATYDLAAGLSDVRILEADSFYDAGKLQINERGDVLLPRGDGASISAWIKRAGRDTFSPPQIIKNYSGSLGPDERMSGASLSLDSRGDVLASWILVNDAGDSFDSAYLGGLDFTRPTLRVRAPKQAKAGQRLRLLARVSDTSGIRLIRWNLGNGKIRKGRAVRYRYNRSGDYSIRVVAVDRAGNKKLVKKKIRIN